MKRRIPLSGSLFLVVILLSVFACGAEIETAALPAAWLESWVQPPCADRPLQITHGLDPRWALPPADSAANGAKSERGESQGMRHYLDYGLGGVVCNVAFQEYMKSETNWNTLVAGIKQCEQLGMTVWIYDEEGYPSGAAGGLVLAENPDFEASELAYDPSLPDPFIIRRSYEFTHANNNYHASRRYVNLIDDRAVNCFIAKTHEAYRQRLEPFFGKTVQAFFTDEPSLMAVNLGLIPEPARSGVRVVDKPDPKAKALPAVPWTYDIVQQYRSRFGEDLVERRKSLFTGDQPEDRRTRSQYWSLIADLIADRYFGALQNWCQAHHVASSGHTLWEEAVMHHVALEGNGLKMLARMDIPGLDVLNSDPESVIHGAWMTAALPCSAASLCQRRRVMTEVSDFSQKMGNAGPAKLPEMQATAAWQACWGVTEFTLYYGMGDRPIDEYRRYCEFVGRLNALLKPAERETSVLLYYPVRDLWSEYHPVAEPLQIGSQSPRAQKIMQSFLKLGQNLQRSQIPFTLVDHEWLAKAKVAANGEIELGGQHYRTLVLPASVELPSEAAATAKKLTDAGGQVLVDQGQKPTELFAPIASPQRFVPSEPRIAMGRFRRNGFTLLLAVNVGKDAYQGKLVAESKRPWFVLNPATGQIAALVADDDGNLPISLAARATMIYVQAGS